jgi:hypothetical protein
MSLTKTWGLITVLCGAPAVALGIVIWIARPDVPAFGITTLAAGLGVTALGGLLMWLGRHPVAAASPGRRRTTDPSALSLILDLLD